MNATLFRRFAVAAAASTLLVTGAVATAPRAAAAPATSDAQAADAESLAAKRALDAIEPTDAADVIDGIEAANAVLKSLGITPFTPTAGLCTDFTFTPAVGGAIAGPMTPLAGDLSVPGILDLNLVKKGEVLFGFVPVGVVNDSASKSGMQVAWFNVNTFKGSLGDPMGGITDTIVDAAKKRIKESTGLDASGIVLAAIREALNKVPQAGVRGALVDTGAGTTLAAMYGTVQKGDATCFFFPSLGIVTAG